jgi:osmoprotectant transport system permease protein
MSGFLATVRRRDCELTLEHLWLTGRGDAAGDGDCGAGGRLADAVSAMGEAGDWRGECAADDSVAGDVWISAAAAVAGGAGGADCDYALTAYALLPILRNTYAGIRGIDPAVIEVARALGLTDAQRLFKVELPLAASFILGGAADGDGDMRGDCDDCGGGGRRRAGRADFSRRGVGG